MSGIVPGQNEQRGRDCFLSVVGNQNTNRLTNHSGVSTTRMANGTRTRPR